MLAPALLTALALASASAAPAAKSLEVNALSFQVVDDKRIVLGETAAVDVEISARDGEGKPLDVAPPALSVSTGSVTPPTRSAPGTWRTTFTPPAERFPHVAILFATIETASSTAVGFTSLHLWGAGATTVSTKPRSKVTVFIGNESFGPVDADADGNAAVPIVVPPGPERAVARSSDEVGNESQKTIDLGVPTFNRLALVALDESAPADGSGVARILAFAVDRKGEPLYDARFSAKASVGDVDAAVPLAPGMFKLAFRPGRAPRGHASVDIVLEGAPASSASASVELLAGRPVRATLDTPKSALSADDERAVAVELRVFDDGGNQVPAQTAAVDVDFGRIDAVEPAPGGARRLTWIIPAQLVRPKATLTARLASTGEVLGQRDIALFAGKPAKASIDPVPDVVADGSSVAELRLRVVDAAGNPLVPAGARFAVDAAWGALVGGTVDGKLYRARFVPLPRDRAEFAVVVGTVGPLRVEQRVKLVPRPRARLLVGAGAVGGSNYGSLLQAGPDLSLLVRLPGFDGAVHAGIVTAMLQSLQAPPGVDHRAFPVALEVAWRPLLSPDLVVHVGGAGGFILTDTLERGAERLVLPGALAQAVVGVGYRVGPGFIELDLRAGYADTFPANPAVGLPAGAAVVVSYRFGI